MSDPVTYDTTYSQMATANRVDIVRVDGRTPYVAMPAPNVVAGGDAFISLERDGFDRSTLTGWKFHLSFNPADVDRAWPIIADVMTSHNVAYVKIADPNTMARFGDALDPQAGKMVTVYDTGVENWSAIMQEVQTRLEAAGVRPGHTVAGDRALGGSSYASYRNDGNAGNVRSNYVGASTIADLPEAQRYNPTNAADPFATIEIDSPARASALRANGASRAAQSGLWNQYSNAQGGDIRMDVTDMPNANRQAILTGMQRHGLGAEAYRSNSLGRDFIRVTDPEAMRMILDAQRPSLPDRLARLGEPVLARSREGVYEYRVAIPPDTSEYDRGRMIDTFRQAGIEVEYYDSSRGPVLRNVGAESLVQMDEMVRARASAAASAVPEVPAADRRAPDSPMRDRPAPPVNPDAPDRIPDDGVMRDHFGRPMPMDPRTGRPAVRPTDASPPVLDTGASMSNRGAPSASLQGAAAANDGAPQLGTAELNPRSQIQPEAAVAPRDGTERVIAPRGDSRVLPVAANDVDGPRPNAIVDGIVRPGPAAPPVPANDVRVAPLDVPPVAPDIDAPRPRVGGARIGMGVATVAMAGLPGVIGYADQRADETSAEAVGRGYRTAMRQTIIAPLESVAQGDYGMAAAQVTETVTMLPIPAYVQAFRTEEIARGIPESEVDRISPSLPPGKMNLGSTNPRLNQIARLLAYREQGTEHLMVGSNVLTAGIMIYGPGAPGMPVAEGQWVTRTDELLNSEIRSFLAEGGTVTGIREATDPQFHREQVFERLRNTVPDQRVPGYQHFPIEARDGMQLMEEFRTGIQSSADATPEGRTRLVDVANEYLKVNDYDESRAISNMRYQYGRLNISIPRPDQLVEAGMGGIFNITGRAEDLRADMENINRVLNTEVNPGETLMARMQATPGSVLTVQAMMNALPPEMQATAAAERQRLGEAATAAAAAAPPPPAPAPVVAPEPEPVTEIVVSGERYRDAPRDRELSREQQRMVNDNGLRAFLDKDGDGKLELGELRSRLRDAGVTIADDGRVSTAQLQQSLPQLQAALRDESQGRA